jgi:hypothetical protein
LIATPGAGVLMHRELIVRIAAQHRLPAIYSTRSHAVSGGLVSYGIDEVAQFRSAGQYERGRGPVSPPRCASSSQENRGSVFPPRYASSSQKNRDNAPDIIASIIRRIVGNGKFICPPGVQSVGCQDQRRRERTGFAS